MRVSELMEDYDGEFEVNLVSDEEFDQAAEDKRKLWHNIFGGSLEVTIPIGKEDDNDIIPYLPEWFLIANEVSEEDKYLVINSNKYRKPAFLQKFFPSIYEKLAKDNTTGDLLLTIDPKWFVLCSDNRYCSWSSCFRPGGEYFQTPLSFCKTEQVLMALIVNSDRTRIIGRRWVIIPSYSVPQHRDIHFLKHYGTFPPKYQRELSAFIISKIWCLHKDDQSLMFSDGKCTSIDGLDSCCRVYNPYGIQYYLDPTIYRYRNLLVEVADDEPRPRINLYNMGNINEHCGLCDRCDDRVDEEDLHRVYVGDREYENYCDWCYNQYTAYSDYRDEAVATSIMIDYITTYGNTESEVGDWTEDNCVSVYLIEYNKECCMLVESDNESLFCNDDGEYFAINEHALRNPRSEYSREAEKALLGEVDDNDQEDD